MSEKSLSQRQPLLFPELSTMDPLVRMKLCQLLDSADAGRDCFALARHLHLEALIESCKEEGKTPTEWLLDNLTVSMD